MIHSGFGAHKAGEVVSLSVQRVLGIRIGDTPGPTLIGIGGMHGNEPAGVIALQRVLDKLATTPLRGEFVALAGNRAALARRRRFLDLDLNRLWGEPPGRKVDDLQHVLAVEQVEQRQLLEEIDAAAGRARGEVLVIDLHTMSGGGIPFVPIGHSRSRDFAMSLRVPLVLGLDSLVQGTLLGLLDRRGISNLVFEGGQHDDPLSVDRAEAALWLALHAAGLLSGEGHDEVRKARTSLHFTRPKLPGVLEMRHRHAIVTGDEFRMEEGYRNLQFVRQGEVLARDANGVIRATQDAHILMPLYQEQGEDGFFLVTETSGRVRMTGVAG